MMKLIELILSTKKKLEKSVFTLSISHRDFTTLAKNKSLQLEKVELQSRRNYIYFHAQFCLTLTAAVIAWALEYS